MSDRAFSEEAFDDVPIVGILRGFDAARTTAAARAAVDGGLRNIEVTMNTAGAEALLEALRAELPATNIGAGTVMDTEMLERALAAGAGFIVTPVVLIDVIAACRERGVPVFPGALTPTEIFAAWRAGATMVKVFPAKRLGPGYIRDIKAPLDELRLMPTGGVDLETIASFHAAGADAYGVGSPLFHRDWIDAEDWDRVRERAAAFVAAYRALAR